MIIVLRLRCARFPHPSVVGIDAHTTIYLYLHTFAVPPFFHGLFQFCFELGMSTM